MHQISRKEDYFVTKVMGSASLETVIAAIKDAYAQPEYFQRNNIFIFSGELFNTKIDQLELVTQYIETHYPPNQPSIKSAVVVPSGFNMAIVEVWATTAHRLPYDLQVFSSLADAEAWITE